MFAGGFIALGLISLLWEALLFAKVYDDPVRAKLASVGASWLSCSAIAGFEMADGGPYAWRVFLIYFVPALALAPFAVRRGRIDRKKAETDRVATSPRLGDTAI
ncbi:MAG TPA: hypothetical protein VFZ91_06865 [Allosphingosinicella sp.]